MIASRRHSAHRWLNRLPVDATLLPPAHAQYVLPACEATPALIAQLIALKPPFNLLLSYSSVFVIGGRRTLLVFDSVTYVVQNPRINLGIGLVM